MHVLVQAPWNVDEKPERRKTRKTLPERYDNSEIYVGNLSSNVDELSLAQFFSESCGQVLFFSSIVLVAPFILTASHASIGKSKINLR